MTWKPPESDRVPAGWAPPESDIASTMDSATPRLPATQEDLAEGARQAAAEKAYLQGTPGIMDAFFPNASRAVAQGSGSALSETRKDILAMPGGIVTSALGAIGHQHPGSYFLRNMAGIEPGAMDRSQRTILGLSFAGGPLGNVTRGALPEVGAAAGPIVRGLSSLARAGAAGVAESLPVAAYQTAKGEIGNAAGSLLGGGLIGSGMQALKAVPGLINRVAGSGAEALTGIAEKDLRKLGPFGNSEYGKKLLSVAENRRQAIYDLSQNLVDKIKNFDQYLPDAGKVDEMVQKLPDIPLKDIVSPLEKAKAAVEKRLTPDAEKAHTVFANLIDRISAHAKDGNIPATLARELKQEYDAVIGDAFGQGTQNRVVDALKGVRHSIAKTLESAAEKSGVPEYAQAMKDYTQKLGALDEVTSKLGGSVGAMRDRAESYISNLFQGNKTNQQEAFKKLSSIMGEDFAEQAKLLADAKRIAPSGKLSWIPNYTTGKAAMGATTAGALATPFVGHPLVAGTIAPLALGLSSPRVAPAIIDATGRLANLASRPGVQGTANAAGRAARAYMQADMGGNQ